MALEIIKKPVPQEKERVKIRLAMLLGCSPALPKLSSPTATKIRLNKNKSQGIFLSGKNIFFAAVD